MSKTLRAACLILGVGAAVLHIACLPFYSGAGYGTLRWRLEHGRMTVKADGTVPSRESFYVAINSEGLRWAPDARLGGWTDWTVTAPLWMIWAPAFAVVLGPKLSRRGERKAALA